MIVHLVLFNPKPNLEQAQIELFARSLTETFGTIPAISRVLVGRRVAVDPGYERSFGDKTYEFSAALEFESQERLVEYLIHPKHEVLGRLFWEVCESTIVAEHEVVDGRSPDLRSILLGAR